MTKSNYYPKIHNRKSQRLKGYDYSNEGLYFITICCQNMEHRFGEIIQIEGANKVMMEFNGAGEMINVEWSNLKNRFQNIELHEFQTMPNHFHGIIEIVEMDGRPQGHAPTNNNSLKNKTISDMLDAFKSITTLGYIRGVDVLGWDRFDKKIWQRNFHDHIIKDEKEYIRISNYIVNNPSSWESDKFNPKNL